MLSFIVKRLLLIIPIALIISFCVFLLLRLGPVDPAQAYLINSNIPITIESLEFTRYELELDKPLIEQYFHWVKNAAHLDFGISYITKQDVLDTLLIYLPTTLKLTLMSMCVLIVFSLPLGIFAALRQNSLFDKGVKLFSFVGVSLPSFWLGFMLIYLFSIKLNWLPPLGNEGFLSYILPVITLSFMSLAINTRLCRASFLESMGKKSIHYLRLVGMDRKKVYGKYTLKNALLPIITSLGMHFGELLGGAFIVETLFALPGLGRYMMGAISNHDYPVIQCFMLMMLLIFLFVNLITDIAYVYLNPKIRYEEN